MVLRRTAAPSAACVTCAQAKRRAQASAARKRERRVGCRFFTLQRVLSMLARTEFDNKLVGRGEKP